MRKLLATALLGTAMIAAPAFAAETNNAAMNASNTGQWQASKLIHMNVYNNNDEKVGDIKELMTDNTGKIENVVIGVGGFLGMGEHDVAVKFDQLKWVNEPAKSASTTTTRPATTSTGAATTGAATTTTTTTLARSDNANRTYPDHAMLNATKDQLKAMPEFKYNK